jgi:chromosome segregation ATPase
MRRIIIGIMLVCVTMPGHIAGVFPQSLADVARKEAERRRQLEQQGVQAKIITVGDPAQLAPGGSISTSTPVAGRAAADTGAEKGVPRASLRSYQTTLQKLDREIRQTEEKIKLLQARLESKRRSMDQALGTRATGSTASLEQMRWQIQELEGDLSGLRRERSDAFQAGRKAGYLPGELEGRGIIR